MKKKIQLLKNFKQNQAKIEHLNNVLRAIRNVNKLITKEKDPIKFIKSSCKLLLETRGYSNVSIYILDEKRKIEFAAYRNINNNKFSIKNRIKESDVDDK